MTLKQLLDLRKKAKAKKPTFRRQDWHLRKKYGEGWKRPRGQQSKMRLKVAGRGALVNPGYRSPSEVRNLSRDGKEIVHVVTMKQLQAVDGKKQTVVIGATVSGRKKVELLKHAMSNDVAIYNIRNPKEKIKTIEDAFALRKQNKKPAPDKKQQENVQKIVHARQQEEQKQMNEKGAIEKEMSDEEKQRREAEKIMIQK